MRGPALRWSVTDALRAFEREVEATPPRREGPPPGLLSWTEAHRSINGRPLRPSELPWLRDLYALSATEIIVMKASQVFVSEWMVSTALWACDTGLGGRGNALYVFPTAREAGDFSQSRVDPAVNESPYLAERTGMVYEDAFGRTRNRASAARVMLKRVGRGHLHFRGADKRRQLLTVDADALLLDEVDEYKAGVVDVARQRLNSALDPLVRLASTPKYPSSGIAPLYGESTRRRYFLPCRGCGLKQPLEFPENLTREGTLVCRTCAHPLSVHDEGEWVAEWPEAEREGIHVNRLYSHRVDLRDVARTGYDVLDHLVTDPNSIQEWWNQTLGLPHAPAGGALTDDVLNGCCRDYAAPAPVTGQPVVLGVDVGGALHWYLKGPSPDEDAANPGGTRMLACGTAPNEVSPEGEVWPEIGHLMRRYRVRLCVVDALPDDEKSARFAEYWRGRAFRCFYHDEAQWRYASASAWNTDQFVVHAQRTRAMDAAFDRFHRAQEELPRDARYHPLLYSHLKAPVRVLATTASGMTVARYQEGLAPDHLAHAATYADLAWAFVTEEGFPASPGSSKPRALRVRA